MSITLRHGAAAALSLIALGAGAAPALATTTTTHDGGRSVLKATIQRLEGATYQTVHLNNPATAIPALLHNARLCDAAARTVAALDITGHAYTSQVNWVSGVGLQAAADRELVAGLRAKRAGHQTLAREELAAGGQMITGADADTSKAVNALGITVPPPPGS